MKTNINKWLLVLIIGAGAFLRLYKLGLNPVSLYWDEAAIGYDAYSLSQTGKDMHGYSEWQSIFPSYGDYKLPLYIWTTALAVKILGPTAMAIRLSSALAGVGLIVTVYFLGRSIFKSDIAGLMAALTVAFSPWAIQFARAGFEANLGLLLLTSFVLALWVSPKKPVWLLAAGILAALGVYAYYSVRFVAPLILLSYLIIFIRKPKKTYWLWLISGIVIYLMIIWPIYRSPLYALSNQFRLSTASILNQENNVIQQNINRELAGNNRISRLLYHRDRFLVKILVANMGSFGDWRYMFFNGDSNLRHGTGRIGLFLAPMGIFFIIGLWTGFKRNLKELAFLLCWWVAALIPAAIPLTVPHALRSLNALPAIAMIIGLGMTYLISQSKRPIKWLGFGFLGLSLLAFIGYWHDYWQHYPARSAADWQYGYEQAAKILGQNSLVTKQIFVENLDRIYLYFLFYNRIKPSEIQWKTKDYQIQAFNNYHFINANENTYRQLNPGDLLMIGNKSILPGVNFKLIQTIYNMQGDPLYLIYAKET